MKCLLALRMRLLHSVSTVPPHVARSAGSTGLPVPRRSSRGASAAATLTRAVGPVFIPKAPAISTRSPAFLPLLAAESMQIYFDFYTDGGGSDAEHHRSEAEGQTG